ncbi:hypothetical protein C8J56DRAFT_884418 [Mycena floridula]|nr:hypothetical protein C8J56DRAFT_884418 [Mycena floridula]
MGKGKNSGKGPGKGKPGIIRWTTVPEEMDDCEALKPDYIKARELGKTDNQWAQKNWPPFLVKYPVPLPRNVSREELTADELSKVMTLEKRKETSFRRCFQRYYDVRQNITTSAIRGAKMVKEIAKVMGSTTARAKSKKEIWLDQLQTPEQKTALATAMSNSDDPLQTRRQHATAGVEALDEGKMEQLDGLWKQGLQDAKDTRALHRRITREKKGKPLVKRDRQLFLESGLAIAANVVVYLAVYGDMAVSFQMGTKDQNGQKLIRGLHHGFDKDGQSFKDWHPNYNNSVSRPFFDFITSCYGTSQGEADVRDEMAAEVIEAAIPLDKSSGVAEDDELSNHEDEEGRQDGQVDEEQEPSNEEAVAVSISEPALGAESGGAGLNRLLPAFVPLDFQNLQRIPADFVPSISHCLPSSQEMRLVGDQDRSRDQDHSMQSQQYDMDHLSRMVQDQQPQHLLYLNKDFRGYLPQPESPIRVAVLQQEHLMHQFNRPLSPENRNTFPIEMSFKDISPRPMSNVCAQQQMVIPQNHLTPNLHPQSTNSAPALPQNPLQQSLTQSRDGAAAIAPGSAPIIQLVSPGAFDESPAAGADANISTAGNPRKRPPRDNAAVEQMSGKRLRKASHALRDTDNASAAIVVQRENHLRHGGKPSSPLKKAPEEPKKAGNKRTKGKGKGKPFGQPEWPYAQYILGHRLSSIHPASWR